ncbi:hypothetical protein BY458DRAFT_508111 [Sporodiniella umbellata]|nr:hypothetical protein BY458DRAFT_508111 [Sporodiniella umbellata]
MQTVRFQLLLHVNSGVKIHAIKCLQVIVFLLTKTSQKDLSLSLVRPDHRVLSIQLLEKEGQDTFETLLNLLNSDIESVLTATVHCLALIAKKRQHLLKPIIARWIQWKKGRTGNDSPVMLRNVEKSIKLAFISLIRTESLAVYRNELLQGFGAVGGNPAMFSNRGRPKRQAQPEEERRVEKRPKLNEPYTPTVPSASAPNVLANYDITQLSPLSIVSLCMTVLQSVPLEVMTERVSMLPKEGVTLAVTRPGFVRSTTPPYPPPPDHPETIRHPLIKREHEAMEEIDSEDESLEATPTMMIPKQEKVEEKVKEEEVKPKVEVLASVEERANQLFRAQPYELVTSDRPDMSDEDRQTMLKFTFQRILQSEPAFSSNASNTIWSNLIAKLVTRGIKSNNNNKVTNEIKESLLNFIVENLPSRNELATAWLNEEHAADGDYFCWFHQLLERGIVTLDAKDRTLSKLLLDAPALDTRCVELVKENLHSVPERFVTSISILRSLVTNKPLVRSDALQVLLDLCIHPNDKMRRTSIVAVKKWNVDQQDIDSQVEAYSIKVLNELANKRETAVDEDTDMSATEPKEEPEDTQMDLTQAGTKEEDKMEEDTKEEIKEEKIKEESKEEVWTEKEVVRYAELYFVLCTKKPSLLKELFSVYTQSSEAVQEFVRAHIVNMIKSIGMKSPDLIMFLRECPEGTETLVIKILTILCESKPPTRDVIATVETLSKERSIDVTSLEPILAGHSLNHSLKK